MKKAVFGMVLISFLSSALPIISSTLPIKAELLSSTTLVSVINPLTGDGDFTFYWPSIGVGDTFVANITVSGVTDLKGWNVKILFNPAHINVMDISFPEDYVFAGQLTLPFLIEINNTIGYAVCGTSLFELPDCPLATFNGTGTLCQLTSNITAEPPECEELSSRVSIDTSVLARTRLVDSEDKSIPFDPVDGLYRYTTLAPDFSLTNINRNDFSLSDYRGTVVLLDFFTTCCVPSVEEISHLESLYEEFGEDLAILSISPENEEVLREFRDKYDIGWTIAKDTAEVFDTYNVLFIPTLFIIDQHGYIRHRHVGLTGENVLRPEIKSLLPPKTLLGLGWGWMRIEADQSVCGRARLYKIGDEKIRLVITCEENDYSRTWNIIFHKEYEYGEMYLCHSLEWGFLIVKIHRNLRWRSWYAVGRGTMAFGFPRFGRLRITLI